MLLVNGQRVCIVLDEGCSVEGGYTVGGLEVSFFCVFFFCFFSLLYIASCNQSVVLTGGRVGVGCGV